MLRRFARYTLLTITSLVFVFALLSGSEDYGGGLMGIVKNSPNALPWLLLFGLNYLVWRKEFLGGIILTIFGIAITIFFNSGPNFWWSTFTLTNLITLLGIVFIYLGKKESKK
ncbi:MAG TPA: hypothetical protein EYQ06_08435 [Flavobacteriales bacterium]|nr:hypothetical protein [Flavobacteriales bacterium]HIL66633.1 hypothetical protein [Flavobacteriales bacterium]